VGGGEEATDADGAAWTADAASLPVPELVPRAPGAPEPDLRIAATADAWWEPVPSTLPRPEYCAIAIPPAMTTTSKMKNLPVPLPCRALRA